MGLAPYGEPSYVDLILEQLIDLQATTARSGWTCEYFDYLRTA